MGFTDGTQLSLRPENLTQRIPVKLLPGGEEANEGDRPEGLDATICGHVDGATGVAAYKLEGIDGEVEVLPEQVRLPEGSMLGVVGLASERGRHLNGRFCCISSWDGTGSYVVQVEGEVSVLKLRPRHLRP